eukprot:CAMPEP_0115299734 /NCGR_PEP_ID=MMETSP0270-20121206/68956_1 /TAXON_ID=71861 /ORGANISM="Scrippsiella trochoidea, Strain CCMP3099" /LENGTH=60 /DNA_ID=CAMNT_0002717511 /DNA_START=35 /DNA_END=214 /DNA_ORIENTATION=-
MANLAECQPCQERQLAAQEVPSASIPTPWQGEAPPSRAGEVGGRGSPHVGWVRVLWTVDV